MFHNKVELFAHPRHGRRTRNWSQSFLVLGLLGGILTAPAIVLAAGTWQWTAQITGNGFPILGPFSTKEQAAQALAAAIVQRCASVGISCPDESTTLHEAGVIAMTANSKTYNYIAVTPSTPTEYSCYFWSADPAPFNLNLGLGPSGCFPDEASAVAAQTSMPGCLIVPLPDGGEAVSINVFLTPSGGWSQLLAQYNTGSQGGL
jgi:hypothetical protein